jgi:hypothetical protein
MFQSIAKEEGIKVKTCKVRAKYDLDEKAMILGVGLSLRFHEFIFNLSSSFPLFPSPCRLRER